jgi:acyl-CoA dehydrogenase
MSELDAFRAEIGSWIEANCPPEMRTPALGDTDACWGGRNFQFQSEAQKLWMERCAEKGLTVPDWPKDCGGAGLSPAETKIFRQEMARRGCRSPLNSFGIWMLGPALLKFGTDEQKDRDRTLSHCRPLAKTKAITGSSTAKRFGPATLTRPTGFFV